MDLKEPISLTKDGRNDRILTDLHFVESGVFVPFLPSWGDFSKFFKPFIERSNIRAIRAVSEGFINGTNDKYERKIRKKVLEFVFKKNFETKTPTEMIELFRQAWKEDKECHERREREIRQQIEKEQTASKFTKTKTNEERLLGKYMSNVLSPSSYNYLKLKNKKGDGQIKFIQREVRLEENEEREITFEVKHLSDKSEMIIDFLFDRYAKRNNAILLKEKPKEGNIIISKEFEEALHHSGNLCQVFVPIEFNSSEFRKHLGIRISDKDIQKAISDLMNTTIMLEGIKLWFNPGNNGNDKKYKKITHEDRIIYSITTEETGRVAPRTGDSQHKFTVTLGLGWSLIFYNNIINRRYACFPKEFYRVGKEKRALGRYLSCWKASTLTIRQISEIIGYHETINIRKRKKDIEAKLDELKRIGIIKNWSRAMKNGKEKTGKNSAWHIKVA